ncbi:NAD(P)-dependent oxidoreductase [Falsihalocynthiibacter arcticus]|uniref:D-isomer specific 2-hydroxyacid dehydrogenase NAD-binding domain-containing protein n=1 Tax=Falsihalocynthiibacter arcticus TaxID=1579316 RepID=A0A126V0U4_9RHOB|nr:NAD(P)-dependent oxidoreductase [Falsihalocynthiibacter arcticus]AML51777.1 hypothetical protein RC74_11330 [Falsihalocynthiibacter arcticus]
MTVGVIGLGGIGRHFGSFAADVRFKVVGWNRSPIENMGNIEDVELEELLLRSDVVSLHLGFNKNTAGFLDDKRLKLMKRDSIFVNTARAELVETTALVRHLSAGTLGHAALDVFDYEPLAVNNVLTRLPKVTLTAHTGFKTRSAMTRLLKMAISGAAKVASA